VPRVVQAALNPAGEHKVARFGWTFAPGDKVMQMENDYDKEVYNGDIGYIVDVDPEAGEVLATFDGRPVTHGCQIASKRDPLSHPIPALTHI
jgi:exodeoxyribonuclease V alpha subunit